MDPNAALSHFVSTMTLPEHSVLNKKNLQIIPMTFRWANGV